MTKVDYAAKLRAGKQVWRRWRKRSPENRIELVDADLAGLDLSDADLSYVDFTLCRFDGTNLTGSFCFQSRFFGCDVKDVVFRDAFLAATLFDSCEMDRSDFSGAQIDWCSFSNTNLSGARGLLDTKQTGPSSIGIDTLLKSGGIPEDFLRRCGIPDDFIAATRGFAAKPASKWTSCGRTSCGVRVTSATSANRPSSTGWRKTFASSRPACSSGSGTTACKCR